MKRKKNAALRAQMVEMVTSKKNDGRRVKKWEGPVPRKVRAVTERKEDKNKS